MSLGRNRGVGNRLALPWALLLFCACAGAPPVVAPALAPPLVFADVLPAGATRVVHVRLAALYGSDVLGPIARTIVRAEDQERLETRFGFRTDQISELTLAIYGDEVLLLLRASRDVSDNVHAIASRMNTVEFTSDEPTLRRSGFMGTARREVAALSPDVLAYGTPGPKFDQLISRSRGQPGGPSVAPALAAFPPVEDVLFTFYDLQPLALPIDTPVGLLLAQEQALQVRLSECEGSVCVSARLHGEFPSGAADNFRSLAEALAASDLARVVAFDEALETLELEQGAEALTAHVRWPPIGLRRGLGRIVAPDLATLLADEP